MADAPETITAWRLTARRFASTAFDGRGAALYGGRWNSTGVPVVYLAATRALAVLEILAQVRQASGLQDYVLIPATFVRADVDVLDHLPSDWRVIPAGGATRRIGAEWASARRSLALQVPSVILPAEFNYVLNPLHPAVGLIRVGIAEPVEFDTRLA